jgi:hypothetical protein
MSCQLSLDYQWTGAEWLGIRFKLGTFMPHLPPRNLLDQRDANLPKATSKSFHAIGRPGCSCYRNLGAKAHTL